jgi:DNA-binding transcriptional LysR family regulator
MPLPGLEAAAAALGYRESGDPFTGDAMARPRLRIGLCSSLSWGFLRALVRRLGAAPDAPRLSFLEGSAHAIVGAVRRGEVDVGFVHGRRDAPQLQCEALWREPLMVLAPDHHPLARDSEARPEALRGETFLAAGGPAERDLHIAILERALGGPAPAVQAVPVERSTVIDLVSLGFGLTLTPGSAMGAFHPGVSYRPLTGQSLAFHAVWRRASDNPALPGVLAAARALAAGWMA